MRIFIAVLVLIFSLQSWTKADDIRDFQIEGMSIGDSALDYLNEKEIKKGIQYNYYNDDLYLASQINKKFDNYDGVTINFFSSDKNYIIQAISGFKFMNIEKCLKERNKIKEVMDKVWPNTSSDEYSRKHDADKTGNSKYFHILYELKEGKKLIGNAVIECVDWSSEVTSLKRWTDNLNLRIGNNKYETWLSNKAYK